MSTLSTLTMALDSICNEIEETGEIPEDILHRFHSLKESHENKLTSYVHVMNTLKLQAAFFSERAETFRAKAKTVERLLEGVKSRVVWSMEQAPDLPWRSSDGEKFRLQNNPPSLEIGVPLSKRSYSNVLDVDTVDVIPKKFVDIVTLHLLNTDAVKKTLQSGEQLPFASLKTGKHLRIH